MDAEDGTARNVETGMPTMVFVDAVKEDITVVEVTEEDADFRTNRDGKSAEATLVGSERRRRRGENSHYVM